jgi:putative nucleotidyltransferase with HDIG domain
MEQADGYVRGIFDAAPEHTQAFGFREKYAHTKRVVCWAQRLLKTEKADADVLLMAALFHDVGYAVSPEGHPARGAEICAAYLREVGYEEAFVARVADCVRRHDDKSLLRDPTTPRELILLIEADCLDETGALSVLRDALTEGTCCGDYRRTYERLLQRSIWKRPGRFPCVTRTARRIWTEKRRLYFEIVKSLAKDLGESGEEL